MKYWNKIMNTVHPEGCVALTWEDAERAEKENKRDGWGFSDAQLLHMVADHMNAIRAAEDGEDVEENYRKSEYIEWRLEDANFHTLCKYLRDNDYKNAINWCGKEVA